MIADTPRVPSGDPLRKAKTVEISGRDLWEAVTADPDLLEEGLTVIARAVPLGGVELPLLAVDSEDRPVLVLGPAGPGEDFLSKVTDCFLDFQALRPTLEKVAPEVWRLDEAPPRVLVLQPADAPPIERRMSLLRGIPVRVLRYRGIAVGDRRGLWIEAREASSRSAPTHRSTATHRVDAAARLRDDARERIMGLSPEIRAENRAEGIDFLLGESEIARVRVEGNGITVTVPPEEKGRRVLGRTDLDDALGAVIERFFEVFASGHRSASKGGVPGEQRPAAAEASPGFGPLPSQAGGILETPDAPFAGMESAPLTHEEIEEFLRSEGEGEA